MKILGETINGEETGRTHIYGSGQKLFKTQDFADEMQKGQENIHTIYLKQLANDFLRGNLKCNTMAFFFPSIVLDI